MGLCDTVYDIATFTQLGLGSPVIARVWLHVRGPDPRSEEKPVMPIAGLALDDPIAGSGLGACHHNAAIFRHASALTLRKRIEDDLWSG